MIHINLFTRFPSGTVVKSLLAIAEDGRDASSIPGLGRSLEEEMATQPTLVFLPEKFHRQSNLVGYSPWGCRVR